MPTLAFRNVKPKGGGRNLVYNSITRDGHGVQGNQTVSNRGLSALSAALRVTKSLESAALNRTSPVSATSSHD
jgi:hypothetical protein